MTVKMNLTSLKEVKPHEYVLRFVFGGLCTVAAGLIAKHFGPGVGGLFLAFPAIFPAGASMVEKHQKKEKEKLSLKGTNRGRAAASIDAAGASIGCVGLIGFALVLWGGLPCHNPYIVVLEASIAWLVLSLALWLFRKSRMRQVIR